MPLAEWRHPEGFRILPVSRFPLPASTRYIKEIPHERNLR